MWLVVGLGNPGREYEGTRHNVGFQVIDELARRHRFPRSKSFKGAQVSRGCIGDVEALLIKPMTYMNLSGDAVGSIMRFYKATPTDVVVVHDELDFEPGEVRLKVGGGHGGHNGLRSIMAHVGRDFLRVRLGIGKPPAADRGADYVLSHFDSKSRRLVDEALQTAADAVEVVVKQGLQRAMNRFNRRPAAPAPAERNDTDTN